MSKKTIILAVFIIFALCCDCGAFDNKNTHRDITERAFDKSELKNWLTDDLGLTLELPNGYDTMLNGQTVIWWLQYGAEQEDEPVCRASNHFHDPLKSWDSSYMSGDIDIVSLAIRSICADEGWPPEERESAIIWATDNTNNIWGWKRAREYYYSALTSSLKNTRDVKLADTFRGLGQVLHLLQDMAVPAHVRNDFKSHLTYIKKAESEKITDNFGSLFEYYVQQHAETVTKASPVFPDFSESGVLTADFWDKNIYTGDNPSYSRTQGLAEITNANYFSENTVPEKCRTPSYKYPEVAAPYKICEHEIVIYTTSGEGGDMETKYKRKYVTLDKDCSPAGAVGFLTNPDVFNAGLNIWNTFIWLDDKVHAKYAGDLCPLAVGYSAELINYFFRGSFDIIPDENTGSGFVIENSSPDNADGIFEIYYDKTDGERVRIWGGNLAVAAGGKSSNVGDIIPPEDAEEPGKYILVFRGKLGEENDAVAGKFVTIEKHPYVIVNIAGYCTVWDPVSKKIPEITDPVSQMPVSLPCACSFTQFRNWLGTKNNVPAEQLYT